MLDESVKDANSQFVNGALINVICRNWRIGLNRLSKIQRNAEESLDA
jgi:hypothetical protein